MTENDRGGRDGKESGGYSSISATTGFVVLFGDPVEHSLSPAMHNAAFHALGLDIVYLACRVEPDRLAEGMRGLWALGGRGANVTVPHKRAALAFADEATPVARALGAANTLVRTASGGRADNTDVAGFLAPLDPHRPQLADASVVVIGAGGAARAVVYAALTGLNAARVVLVARRAEQAEALADDLSEVGRVDAVRFGDAGPAIHDAALVVNATPVGMGDGRTPWANADDFHAGQIVYDLVYRPRPTPLLEAAASRGATAIDGLPMLLGQAADAFRQWTGRGFPLGIAEQAALSALAPTA